MARSPSARAWATLSRTRSLVSTEVTRAMLRHQVTGRKPLASPLRSLRARCITSPANPREEIAVAEYIPSPRQWVREQVEVYERTDGKEGTTLRETGLPVII